MKKLDHIDLWLKMILNHFHKHKIQGRLFFTAAGMSILVYLILITLCILNYYE